MCYRIVVADDHELTLDGVVRTLKDAADMEVVGTAGHGSDVMQLVKSERPDIALLDYHMPGMDGLACLKLIKRSHPEVKVVMLSGFEDREHIEAAFEAGANAYVIKSVKPIDLSSALRQVCMGSVYHAYGGSAQRSNEPKRDDHGLTEREKTMLAAVARGLSNKAISRELWVTEQTVKFHLNNVYRKLNVENRAAAVCFAFENGLVESAASHA